ncbi:MAG: Protease HtpX-like protein [Candidatus Magasanikbacteria bacterium GW2011_GWA2_37_8]|uniref:Protease HtpX homolog n=1 Tax=Candidatus Magasanikbacteria bacterium GW2011_GWA2_37_8 TaxID=1619036 RepID=A0A0G0HQA5_9BACT|nr:MAG: Protease HtpX-like protein [Candidatus Magasanikbacteria bacterium GW2011_GWA2_37_8]
MYSQIDSNKRKTGILMAIFLAFIISIAWFADQYLGYNYELVIFAIIISAIMTLVSYYKGDAIALVSTGAKQITEEENQRVFHLIENLSITAGVPMPKIYLINSPALNAFACGRDPEHASIALTTGIINALTDQELEGVIAHEMSHVKNYDIRLMTVVVVLVGTIALLSNWFFRIRMFGGKRNNDNGGGQLGGIIMIVGLILLILSPIIAELIKLAISRKREYLADADGVLLTRYPEGLASALEKISSSNIPMANASAATAHLFISNPLKAKSFTGLFSTHPPIEDRINKLRGMI